MHKLWVLVVAGSNPASPTTATRETGLCGLGGALALHEHAMGPELAKWFGPNRIYRWKGEFIENAARVFAGGEAAKTESGSGASAKREVLKSAS